MLLKGRILIGFIGLFLFLCNVYGDPQTKNGEILFSENFNDSDLTIKNLKYTFKGWEISNGVIKNKTQPSRSCSLGNNA